MSLVYLVKTNQNHLKEANMEIFDLIKEIKKQADELKKLQETDPLEDLFKGFDDLYKNKLKEYKNGNKQKNVS